jgi:hypothetical protein
MSPVPEPNESFFEQLKNGGGTAFLVAASGMAARILLSAKKVSWWKALRHVLAAGITGVVVGKVLQQVEMTDGLRMACVAISGATADRIIDFAMLYVSERLSKLKE